MSSPSHNLGACSPGLSAGAVAPAVSHSYPKHSAAPPLTKSLQTASIAPRMLDRQGKSSTFLSFLCSFTNYNSSLPGCMEVSRVLGPNMDQHDTSSMAHESPSYLSPTGRQWEMGPIPSTRTNNQFLPPRKCLSKPVYRVRSLKDRFHCCSPAGWRWRVNTFDLLPGHGQSACPHPASASLSRLAGQPGDSRRRLVHWQLISLSHLRSSFSNLPFST